MRFRDVAVLASIGASTACGGAVREGGASHPASGTEGDRTMSPGADASRTVERTFTLDGQSRRYVVFLPSRYDGARRLPLVVMLHGCTQNARDIALGTRLNEVAESNGVIVVYPEQPATSHPQTCWNWYDPAHQGRDGGEPALIAGITREAQRELNADPHQTYLGGISAGGAMALLVAVAYPELYAGVATHSGTEYRAATSVPQALATMQQGGPDPVAQGDAAFAAMGERAYAMPLIIFHGAADPTVRVVNARQTFDQWLQLLRRAGAWANGAAPATSNDSGTLGGYSYARSRVRDPKGRVVLEQWTIDSLGHKWSGGSTDGTYTDPNGPDATREMMRFFLEHRRP